MTANENRTDVQPPVSCPVCQGSARYDFSNRDLMFDLYERHDYFRCESCACVFMHPMPSPARIASFYPANYDIYEEKPPRPPKLWRRLQLRALGYTHLAPGPIAGGLACLLALFSRPEGVPFVQDGRLLDIGCGNGRFLANMRQLGWQVQGVEFSEDGVRVCRKAGLEVHHGDLASAKLPDASFDVITIRHVIEHIPDPHGFAAEFSRLLKPGGTLVLETPNSDALGRSWFASNWFANETPRHLYLFAPNNLRLLLSQYGLTELSCELSSTPKIFLNSVDYVVKNRGRASKHIAWRRALARFYVWLAKRSQRGDVIHMTLTKQTVPPGVAA